MERTQIADLGAGQPLPSDDFFKRCSDLGQEVAPLFGAPRVSTSTISVDRMHCVELGVAQDVVGHILWECIHKAGVLPGHNQNDRLASLNDELKTWYDRAKPSNPIHRLTKKMIRRDGEQPKLRSKAAESRGIQGFAKELALKFAEVYPSQCALKIVYAIDALLACSAAVSSVPFDVQELQRTGNAFLEACSWLHNFSEDDNLWRMKPKHHMFKHMIAEVAPKQGSPNLYWCWADESLGGKLSKAAARRGGKHNPELISQHLMTRVSALQWCKP